MHKSMIKLKEILQEAKRDASLVKNFKELLLMFPKEVRGKIMRLKCVPQNPKWHPEGNTLKHTILVVRRAIEYSNKDADMIIAALFHDVGKYDTLGTNPKTGQPTAFGHEKVSAEEVEKYKDAIESLGGNVNRIKAIVKDHMRIKKYGEMRQKKKEQMEAMEIFDDLKFFCNKLDKGGIDI